MVSWSLRPEILGGRTLLGGASGSAQRAAEDGGDGQNGERSGAGMPKNVGSRAVDFQSRWSRKLQANSLITGVPRSTIPRALWTVQLRFSWAHGSGKSARVELARRAGRGARVEIIALDSMTVQGPRHRDRQAGCVGARWIPHHLVDVADPTDRFDLQAYVTLVEEALTGMEERGAARLHGGLYLAALVRGLFQGPPIDRALRERLEAEAASGGLEQQRERLRAVDPEAFERIHAGDARRTIRALEVHEQTGVPLSEHQRQWSAQRGGDRGAREIRSRIAGLELPTEVLDMRIRERTSQMLDAGWPEEAMALADAGALGPSAGQALGYSTAAALGRGEPSATRPSTRSHPRASSPGGSAPGSASPTWRGSIRGSPGLESSGERARAGGERGARPRGRVRAARGCERRSGAPGSARVLGHLEGARPPRRRARRGGQWTGLRSPGPCREALEELAWLERSEDRVHGDRNRDAGHRPADEEALDVNVVHGVGQDAVHRTRRAQDSAAPGSGSSGCG